jgi:hypothetical protein
MTKLRGIMPFCAYFIFIGVQFLRGFSGILGSKIDPLDFGALFWPKSSGDFRGIGGPVLGPVLGLFHKMSLFLKKSHFGVQKRVFLAGGVKLPYFGGFCPFFGHFKGFGLNCPILTILAPF